MRPRPRSIAGGFWAEGRICDVLQGPPVPLPRKLNWNTTMIVSEVPGYFRVADIRSEVRDFNGRMFARSRNRHHTQASYGVNLAGGDRRKVVVAPSGCYAWRTVDMASRYLETWGLSGVVQADCKSGEARGCVQVLFGFWVGCDCCSGASISARVGLWSEGRKLTSATIGPHSTLRGTITFGFSLAQRQHPIGSQ
ncbi:hypothetical protein N658DRAFT_113032 [Parathielavia hyrcaniae]|uniref:Uncharacterized protein n=1 Tax=Parathielavia hyrcaniae TaxID=113614 RepID=A0AAN6T5X0_9PEZI|nr:hypothetical protein N658DRAFT_113032 [Parathielavia hyrcaniae]